MKTIKRYGNIIIFTCIILEMLFWPSINNFFGCLMTAISWLIFSKIGLNEHIIREHIFSWLAFLTMSLYRVMPLIVTMLEGHSIGYNLVLPLSTYCGETLLYLISASAFYLAINCKSSFLPLKKFFFRCGFYDQLNNKTLWSIGILGFGIYAYVVSRNIELGDVIGKTLVGFSYFRFAPLLLFFPVLTKKEKNRVVIYNPLVLFYLILLVIVAFATNHRTEILAPIGTLFLLFILSYLNCGKTVRNTINKKHIVYGIFLVVFIYPIINDISLAMLFHRNYRNDISRVELFRRTIDTFLDNEKMETLHLLAEKKELKEISSSIENNKNWTEVYVKNFVLNRYCNLKVTDNTLYHARKVGYPNEVMYDNFWYEIFILLPTPISKFLGLKYDKTEYCSSGDRLKALSENRHPHRSNLITSNLADGLLTFGYWYFPIEFLLFFVRFLFLDTFLLRNKEHIFYSVLGLMTIFRFLAMGIHSGGCSDSLQYMLRGYWQDVILFIIAYTFIKKIAVRL